MMMMMMSLITRLSHSIRCYTDLEATQAASVECGMATGCVKILRKALDFDHYGRYIPEHKRGPDVDLFRGCFLISTPDVCHNARNGLTYCWCSSTDLCNQGSWISRYQEVLFSFAL